MGDDHTRAHAARVLRPGRQIRVPEGSRVSGCMGPLDLAPAVQVRSSNVDERGVVMEQASERRHVVLVPCTDQASGQLGGDLASAVTVHSRTISARNANRGPLPEPQPDNVHACAPVLVPSGCRVRRCAARRAVIKNSPVPFGNAHSRAARPYFLARQRSAEYALLAPAECAELG
jgi:hypothetical protein